MQLILNGICPLVSPLIVPLGIFKRRTYSNIYMYCVVLYSFGQQGASSKATKSFPATVMNLSEQEPDITFESLINTIGRHFLAEVGQKVYTKKISISCSKFHITQNI